MSDHKRAWLQEECGVVALLHHERVAQDVVRALSALQHRGQESVGVALGDTRGPLKSMKALGLVAGAFDQAELSASSHPFGIGHVRYSTTGDSSLANAQPLIFESKWGPVGLAHNGNLTNARRLRAELESQGCVFQTQLDTEVVAWLVARADAPSLRDALVCALEQVQGAWSMVGVSHQGVFGVRDPHGIRPLSIGRRGDSWGIASESCALDAVGYTSCEDIQPGELRWIDARGTSTSSSPFAPAPPAPCVFELVYFSRPDSQVFGRDVRRVRTQWGQTLGRSHDVEADVVVGVPLSGMDAARGYGQAAGLPVVPALTRHPQAMRTFIEPEGRADKVAQKFQVHPEHVRGKRVVLVDDSLVRGTTSRHLSHALRAAGALCVHVRVASPRVTGPCYYGIDTSRQTTLLASGRTTSQMCAWIGADSLRFLSREDMLQALEGSRFCHACFGGAYPVATHDAVPNAPGIVGGT